MTENQMTCAECDELFLDFFEHELKGADRSRFAEHVSTCLRCQGVIRDIHGIQRQAADLPEMIPSRDLWSGIGSRIQPEVRSIASGRSASTSRTRLAAAAAALVIATSGVTYVVTSRSTNNRAVAGKSAATIVSAPQVAMADPEVTVSPEVPEHVAAPAASHSSAAPARSAVTPVRTTPSASLASSSPSPRAATASEIAFAGEIIQLQSVVAQRRSQLDPQTVKVVEDNLKVIDTAVQRARSALAKDPASGFLTRQLDGVLQKKVELLRTAALLPSST